MKPQESAWLKAYEEQRSQEKVVESYELELDATNPEDTEEIEYLSNNLESAKTKLRVARLRCAAAKDSLSE